MPLSPDDLYRLEPATDDDLTAALEAGEVRGPLVDVMVYEIRMHRELAVPGLLRAVRVYTDEMKQLRAALAEALDGWYAMTPRHMTYPPRDIPGGPADRIAELRKLVGS